MFVHGRGAKSPNDQKLSDGGVMAQHVPNGGAPESRAESADAPNAEAQAVTERRRSVGSVLMWGVKLRKSPIRTETLSSTLGLCAMAFALKVGGGVWKAMQGDGARVVAVEVTPLNQVKERRKPVQTIPQKAGAPRRRKL